LCQNGRIAPDEDLDETQGLSAAEIEERDRSREAHAQATILEIVGDLPDADMAPPENVLFVCKLNPVTSDDDLEIIFSRFGKVKRSVSDVFMVLSPLPYQDA
jgi:peptidyl-prolyl cis-trans isomerase-like 4